jgi:uncharacterized membrane protein
MLFWNFFLQEMLVREEALVIRNIIGILLHYHYISIPYRNHRIGTLLLRLSTMIRAILEFLFIRVVSQGGLVIRNIIGILLHYQLYV